MLFPQLLSLSLILSRCRFVSFCRQECVPAAPRRSRPIRNRMSNNFCRSRNAAGSRIVQCVTRRAGCADASARPEASRNSAPHHLPVWHLVRLAQQRHHHRPKLLQKRWWLQIRFATSLLQKRPPWLLASSNASFTAKACTILPVPCKRDAPHLCITRLRWRSAQVSGP